jgi:hypothetical protein
MKGRLSRYIDGGRLSGHVDKRLSQLSGENI